MKAFLVILRLVPILGAGLLALVIGIWPAVAVGSLVAVVSGVIEHVLWRRRLLAVLREKGIDL